MSWAGILKLLDLKMEEPEIFGWFHITFLVLTFAIAAILCFLHKNASTERVRKIVFVVAVTVIILEIYKQINYSFSYTDGKVTFNYQWYAFPWQFCSMPMYVGFLAGIFKKGKVHDALCAFLATYAIFAGLCVMAYPVTAFIETIGINIQTMICHGSMITIGIYLLYTKHVKLEHKTILKAMPVFVISVLLAMLFNEIAFRSGLLDSHTFNMFFISPHCEPSLPVYSLVQGVLAYPWCLLVYVGAFTFASYLILLLAMGINKLASRVCKKKSGECRNDRILEESDRSVNYSFKD